MQHNYILLKKVILIIKNLHVKHFKTVNDLDIECSRVNVFIGEPNTGKTNILESIGFLSWLEHNTISLNSFHLNDFVRHGNLYNLFYNNEFDKPFEIGYDNDAITVSWDSNNLSIDKKGGPKIGISTGSMINFTINPPSYHPGPFKFYKFKDFNKQTFTSLAYIVTDYLLPPNGANMITLLQTNKGARNLFSNYIKNINLKLVINQQNKTIEFQKEIEDAIHINFPIETLSDTMLRIISHMIAIESNKNSVITFDEPESYAFPYYTKVLAEMIALDKTNQFFVTTHNPYVFYSILEKVPKKEGSIFITYLEKDKDTTKVKKLSKNDIDKLYDENGVMGMDVFFNLNKFM